MCFFSLPHWHVVNRMSKMLLLSVDARSHMTHWSHTQYANVLQFLCRCADHSPPPRTHSLAPAANFFLFGRTWKQFDFHVPRTKWKKERFINDWTEWDAVSKESYLRYCFQLLAHRTWVLYYTLCAHLARTCAEQTIVSSLIEIRWIDE